MKNFLNKLKKFSEIHPFLTVIVLTILAVIILTQISKQMTISGSSNAREKYVREIIEKGKAISADNIDHVDVVVTPKYHDDYAHDYTTYECLVTYYLKPVKTISQDEIVKNLISLKADKKFETIIRDAKANSSLNTYIEYSNDSVTEVNINYYINDQKYRLDLNTEKYSFFNDYVYIDDEKYVINYDFNKYAGISKYEEPTYTSTKKKVKIHEPYDGMPESEIGNIEIGSPKTEKRYDFDDVEWGWKVKTVKWYDSNGKCTAQGYIYYDQTTHKGYVSGVTIW